MREVLLFIVIGLLSMSCSSEYIDIISENSIDSDINFMVEEVPDASQKPGLILNMTTVDIFPCINYRINFTQFGSDTELIIRFDGIEKPDGCYTALGPATTFVNLPENINLLTLINGNKTDKYSINISSEKITVKPIQRTFSNSLYNTTFRIPENSFAFVCGTNTNNTHIYEDFLSILRQEKSFTEFEFKGNGRIPYPEASDGYWVNHPSKFFIYSDSTAYKNLETTLRNFSKDNIEANSGVSIAIYGWNNLNYFSWWPYPAKTD